MIEPGDGGVLGPSVVMHKKYGDEAARLHREVADAVGRCTFEATAEVLRYVVRDMICGKFHSVNVKARTRRTMFVEAMRSVPADRGVDAWAKDLIRRVKCGSYFEVK